MVSDGNLEPHLFPSGANEDGPVLPWQPPITFGQTTKYLSVSNGRPGPTICGHQPLTSAQPVKAWFTNIALSPVEFNLPQL
ncbi:unannotated protein [freshwater metagenome]|uniref:Unannotated protein n=1 Tax=freshwater metagenome TaxID=449393 RepID=A0A6J7L9Q9_9ZZZZ